MAKKKGTTGKGVKIKVAMMPRGMLKKLGKPSGNPRRKKRVESG